MQLIRQVAPAEAAIAYAAGVGADHQEIGTDALEIAQAIRAVFSDSGVLVLMDLGSAVLSAELALDLLSEDERQKVRLCPAPLVEGALAAAAQLTLSEDLDQICQEAQQALTPKQSHLGFLSPSAFPSQPSVPEPTQDAGLSIIVRLENPHGLHARPATQLIQTAARYDAQVWVTNLERHTPPVEAVSLNALLALGATQGQRLQITARGKQAAEVLSALQALIPRWGESAVREETPSRPLTDREAGSLRQADAGENLIQAIPIAEGIAVAPLVFFGVAPEETISPTVLSPTEEWQRLQTALQKAERVLQARYERLKGQLGEEKAAIFQAQQLFLRDPHLLDRVHQLLLESNLSAFQGWKQACEEIANSLKAAEDAYLRQRALDILDVSRLVLSNLGSNQVEPPQLSEAGILAAEELTPNQVAELDPQKVRGVILVGGGATSHSAILLRGLGIPAVGGVNVFALGLSDGDWVGIDGAAGLVWLKPNPAVRANLEAKAQKWKTVRQELLQHAQQPARTKDGVRLVMAANVGSLIEARLAAQSGAEGIGVLRTEFLYQNRSTPPSESEQIQVYCQLAEVLKPHTVVVRTLDVGGDKSPAYLSLPTEANPYLGLRGLRVSLCYPELFLTQIRAILRAAERYPIHLLLPMIATLEELEQVQQLLLQAHETLSKMDVPHRYPIPIGIMIETPAAVLLAPQFAEQVEFFSVGTNDLTQYTFAAERGNPALSAYNDALHPAILRQIQDVIETAHQQGKRVTVCGEVAGEAEALPVLVGLEADELSMNPHVLPKQKAILEKVDRRAARFLAQQALGCKNAAQVRQLAHHFLEEIGMESG
jgi:phosphocarrier protein FPr